jgi:hypothetical protein
MRRRKKKIGPRRRTTLRVKDVKEVRIGQVRLRVFSSAGHRRLEIVSPVSGAEIEVRRR